MILMYNYFGYCGLQSIKRGDVVSNLSHRFDESHITDVHGQPVQLNIGSGSHVTAHETFHDYYYDNAPVVIKMNRRISNSKMAAIFEVGFGAIAKLFIKPGLTPTQHIMLKNGEVRGVVSRNMSYELDRLRSHRVVYKLKQALNQNLALFTNDQGAAINTPWQPLVAGDSAKLGLVFLNETPQIFFDELLRMHQQKIITIDMDSLASIFTAAYVLEEDDLHKGNFGFYATHVAGQIVVTFFKIDHDLMFNDSIMSRQHLRLANIAYNGDSFKITRRDILQFPDLQDSGNHYWPTKWRFITDGSSKTYYRREELDAFATLKKDADFNNAKWYYFLKIIVMPREFVLAAVTYHLDPVEDATEIAMIQTALDERLAKLRQTLLSIKSFRMYLLQQAPAIIDGLAAEIDASMEDVDYSVGTGLITDAFQNLTAAAQLKNPLCRSVLLGDYAFTERLGSIGRAIAIAEKEFYQAQSIGDESRAFKYACIIVDLAAKEKKRSLQPIYQTCLDTALDFKKTYLETDVLVTFEDFQLQILKIREAGLPLKQQKREVLALLTGSQLSPYTFALVQAAIQCDAPNSPLKFVRQLRSSLWIVRQFRGMYGWTDTVHQMRIIIADKLRAAAKTPSTRNVQRFWVEKQDDTDSEDNADNDHQEQLQAHPSYWPINTP